MYRYGSTIQEACQTGTVGAFYFNSCTDKRYLGDCNNVFTGYVENAGFYSLYSNGTFQGSGACPTPPVTPTKTPPVSPTQTPSVSPTTSPVITPSSTPQTSPTKTPTVTPGPSPSNSNTAVNVLVNTTGGSGAGNWSVDLKKNNTLVGSVSISAGTSDFLSRYGVDGDTFTLAVSGSANNCMSISLYKGGSFIGSDQTTGGEFPLPLIVSAAQPNNNRFDIITYSGPCA